MLKNLTREINHLENQKGTFAGNKTLTLAIICLQLEYAKAIVASAQREAEAELNHKNTMEITPEELEFIKKKDKVGFIKSFRARLDLDLRTAKQKAEEYLVDNGYATWLHSGSYRFADWK